MRQFSKLLVTSTAASLWLLCVVSTPSFARSPKSSSNSNNSNNNTQQNNPNQGAIDAAQKQVESDQAEVTKDQAALENVAKPLRDQINNSPEMTEAQTTAKTASATLKAAISAADASLVNDPAYKAAVQKKDAASDQLKSLKQSGGSPEDIAAAASTVMDAGASVTKAQAAAEKADPKIAQSREDLNAADKKISELQKQAQDAVRNDPNWITAKKTLTDAQAKLSTDQKAVTAAENQ